MRATNIPIGELSRLTGVHIETIRYYERIDIMPEPPRTAGGRRIYDHDHVKRLTFIARSRQLGFSLDTIRSLLDLVDARNISCEEVRCVTLDHAAEARRKISDLKKLERILRAMAEKCQGGDVPDCAIIDALFDDHAM